MLVSSGYQQFERYASRAECWPHFFWIRARGVNENGSWQVRYTHARVEPHSNMTRLEQCDGMSYGRDQSKGMVDFPETISL